MTFQSSRRLAGSAGARNPSPSPGSANDRARAAGNEIDNRARDRAHWNLEYPALQLAADDHLSVSINAMGPKNRLRDIETDCRGDHSYGAHLAIGFAAADVRAAVIEDSSHWIMEEQPEQAVTIILSFLKGE